MNTVELYLEDAYGTASQTRVIQVDERGVQLEQEDIGSDLDSCIIRMLASAIAL